MSEERQIDEHEVIPPATVIVDPEVAKQVDAYLRGRGAYAYHESRFKQAKSLLDDILNRITWRGFFMFLMGVELVTDGPNGAIEQLLEGALRTFGGG